MIFGSPRGSFDNAAPLALMETLVPFTAEFRRRSG
jgi:hypothetical protein